MRKFVTTAYKLSLLIGVVMTQATCAEIGIDESVKELLKCASLKDYVCVSKLAARPDQLYVQMPNKGREPLPYFVDDAFSEKSKISLYQVAARQSVYVWRVFKVSSSHSEVVFYRNGSIPANAPYSMFAELVGRSEAVQCGFLKIGSAWKLSDSICGYVDDGG